ncbi:cytidylyltransferase domain-containing protein [Sphingobacterium spiritivorum]|uniref:acylneuraminate cytidylyltransferase family protein n=1 Tax=Sphingobacterium spiritivorum TaxID=258 RepID=UPI001919284D|nr:acylneuraminate cytidylyltransferase family protein [Sphingobacterium spiritivorum]QQT27801.1 acylneuraminate cytidylyltransferase family protein [Sphingobacterium spiritivorum]
MITKDILVLIPARGGSKGVPKKNIKLFSGRPLIEYTLEFANQFFSKEDICVSTDSEEIKAVVENLDFRVPFLRPMELATDYAGTREVLLHGLDFFQQKGVHYKYILLLQPTTPFRDFNTFNTIMDLKSRISDFDMIVSVKESKANPYFNLFEEDDKGLLRLSKSSNYVRRQDCPNVYEYNGAFYLIDTRSLKDNEMRDFQKIHKVVNNESVYNIDIDTPDDWERAELLIKKK